MTAETSNARGEWVLRLTALDGLVDRIAEAIRDGAGLAEGDPPWERLGEERRAPWRADAKRALSVIKESLTAEMGAGVGEPDMQYADADALIAHLDSLYDDNGQGGDKWDVAQAAIAGIRAARRPAAVRGLVAKWRERAATNSGAFAAAANVVCANELESALAAEGVQADPKPEARGVVDEMSPRWMAEVCSTAADAMDANGLGARSQQLRRVAAALTEARNVR